MVYAEDEESSGFESDSPLSAELEQMKIECQRCRNDCIFRNEHPKGETDHVNHMHENGRLLARNPSQVIGSQSSPSPFHVLNVLVRVIYPLAVVGSLFHISRYFSC